MDKSQCNYCENPKHIKGTIFRTAIKRNKSMMYDFILYIKEDKLIADYDAYSADSSFDESIKINYCPMCGKKLKKND
jgi:hypothetical protein